MKTTAECHGKGECNKEKISTFQREKKKKIQQDAIGKYTNAKGEMRVPQEKTKHCHKEKKNSAKVKKIKDSHGRKSNSKKYTLQKEKEL